jgi:polyhydroxyalkanoate synthesis regulator phasin
MALFTTGIAELTRNRAEALVRDLVKAGEVPRQQASSVVREVLERSRANRTELVALIRGEIRHQIEALGLATARDLERLERRVARLETGAKAAGPTARKRTKTSKTAAGKKTTQARRSAAGPASSTVAEESGGPGG